MKNKNTSKLVGYEKDLKICDFAKMRLMDYKNVIIKCESTEGELIEYNDKNIIGDGNILQECKNNQYDAIFIDGSDFEWRNNDQKASELYIARDICRPKYLAIIHLHYDYVYEFYLSTRKNPEWELLIKGTSYGYGCFPENSEPREYAIFVRVSK